MAVWRGRGALTSRIEILGGGRGLDVDRDCFIVVFFRHGDGGCLILVSLWNSNGNCFIMVSLRR